MRVHSLLLNCVLILSVMLPTNAFPASVLAGAGSSAASLVYGSWAQAYADIGGTSIRYDPVGSSAGLARIKEGSVDFGASDVVPDDRQNPGATLVVFPTMVTGAVPVVNLPLPDQVAVRLDGAALADIFLGRIARWNAPRLAALNPGVSLPDLPILRVVRSDGSGTTHNFSDYLSKVSDEWRSRYGVASKFDWAGEVMRAKGSGEMARLVAATRGAIGYVDFSYVVDRGLRGVQLRNREGRFVGASAEAFAAALAASAWPATGEFSSSLTDMPGARSWPLTMGTFVLLERRSREPARARQVVDFFTWAFLHGDELVARGAFVRLPDRVQAKAYRALTSVVDVQGNPVGFGGLAAVR
ncbi:phosphate ABC transporter substrate-binding protein PstS [Azoarcus sp. L1K30]|uniref:phosphate ABC transporter substrate-binding protein PstS n=1 Tax=Azoarcus sp. L1K30 TaxID=2820277 RepID=UPI001B82BAC7|nr:phosphate ABC transporter substrate-binding protein PstS [Azoarcus sp. L1K30]MBR0565506.1 phosphate ABC transporter substrate-binding protein PstS [Azoarcus sp. L1K30]